jgi:hypothetical protein
MVECVPNDHITITVESFTSKEAKDKLAERDDPNYATNANEPYDYMSYEQYMPVDTYHELSWPESGIIDMSQIENDVWNLPLFVEHVDATSAIDDRDAIIAEMASMLTEKQLNAVSRNLTLKTMDGAGSIIKSATAEK